MSRAPQATDTDDTPPTRHHASGPLHLFAALGTLAAVAALLAAWWLSHSPPAKDPSQPSAQHPAGVDDDVALRPVSPGPGDTGRLVPGLFRVTDVHATSGGWALLDGRNGRVALVGTDGAVQASLGRPGQGPGELSAPAHVARRGLEVAVLDVAGTRLDRFGPGGEVQARLPLARGDCSGSMATDLTAFEGAWIVARRCTTTAGVTVEVLRVDDGGQVHVVTADPVAGEAADPFLRPLLLEDGSLYLGSTRAACLRRIAGVGPRERCLRDAPTRPLPDDLRAALEGPLAGRARSVGMELRVPDHLPVALAVRSLPGGALAVQRPLDGELAPWHLEPVEAPVERLVSPVNDRIEPGPAGLLILRHELDGVRSWLVPTGSPEP